MFQGEENKTQSRTEIDTRVRKVIRDDGVELWQDGAGHLE
jgi:hypothetical protein